jgi:23S rRNA pseudouridine1911/1915/1917 synthase
VGRVVVALTGLSNKKVRGLFDHGCVAVNGEPCSHAGQKVQAGDQVEVNYDPAQGYPLKKREWEDASFSVVFEDAHLIVVNKAANVLTVATDRGGERNTLVDRVSHYLKHTGRRREALVVHRLDRGVSGLLVFAKSQRMLEALQDQFKERKPDRRYIAIVAGILERESGTYRSHLATGKALNQYSTRDESKGELAITHYRLQKQLSDTAVVEVQLETGRRNQIRVQFADHGHPVLGDPRYGVSRSQHERWPEHRIALHALSLGFVHPATGKPLRFESELPNSMQRFISEQASRSK